MERSQVIKILGKILEEIIDNSQVLLSDESTKDDVVGWDSLTNIQFVVEIEKKFNLRFSSEEMIGWKSVREMVDCIIKKTEKNKK